MTPLRVSFSSLLSTMLITATFYAKRASTNAPFASDTKVSMHSAPVAGEFPSVKFFVTVVVVGLQVQCRCRQCRSRDT